MSRVAYVNGRYVRHAEASVHIEDRGFQFADGVYEVWAVFGGKLCDVEGHMERLDRSLGELQISAPMSERALRLVLRETLRRNQVTDGMVYLQITRGSAPRDHAFPDPAPHPTLVITAKPLDYPAMEAKARKGVGVISAPDNRWGRCDIKTVGLLPNAMAKTAAREQGAFEAWLYDGMGFVTEGASTNAWIVDADGALRTRDTNANILRGITRKTLIDLAEKAGVPVSLRPFTIEEAKGAKEAFLTAASAFITPIVRIDGSPVGDGTPGPVTLKMRALYLENARATAR